MPLKKAAKKLQALRRKGIDLIFHHMFLEGVNDSEEELCSLIDWMKQFPGGQLRVLRYNPHEKSQYKESEMFEQCVCFVKQHINNVKIQVSYGQDIKSACGQFIYNKD